MESIELIDIAVYPTAGWPTAKEGGVRVNSYQAVKDALDVSMTPEALRALSSIREDAMPILRRHERRGFSRLTSYTEDQGGVAVTHIILARDGRVIAPPKPRTPAPGGQVKKSAKGEPATGARDEEGTEESSDS